MPFFCFGSLCPSFLLLRVCVVSEIFPCPFFLVIPLDDFSTNDWPKSFSTPNLFLPWGLPQAQTSIGCNYRAHVSTLFLISPLASICPALFLFCFSPSLLDITKVQKRSCSRHDLPKYLHSTTDVFDVLKIDTPNTCITHSLLIVLLSPLWCVRSVVTAAGPHTTSSHRARLCTICY